MKIDEYILKSFYEARIILISKFDKVITQIKLKYRSMSFMNNDSKVLNKIIANPIHWFIFKKANTSWPSVAYSRNAKFV